MICCSETPGTTDLRCVTCQKSEDLLQKLDTQNNYGPNYGLTVVCEIFKVTWCHTFNEALDNVTWFTKHTADKHCQQNVFLLRSISVILQHKICIWNKQTPGPIKCRSWPGRTSGRGLFKYYLQLTLAVACSGEKPTVPCLWSVIDVFQLKIHWPEVQSCFVRVKW